MTEQASSESDGLSEIDRKFLEEALGLSEIDIKQLQGKDGAESSNAGTTPDSGTGAVGLGDEVFLGDSQMVSNSSASEDLEQELSQTETGNGSPDPRSRSDTGGGSDRRTLSYEKIERTKKRMDQNQLTLDELRDLAEAKEIDSQSVPVEDVSRLVNAVNHYLRNHNDQLEEMTERIKEAREKSPAVDSDRSGHGLDISDELDRLENLVEEHYGPIHGDEQQDSESIEEANNNLKDEIEEVRGLNEKHGYSN
jgi:vacuolar-type H+-ATPase subunit I/STV1